MAKERHTHVVGAFGNHKSDPDHCVPCCEQKREDLELQLKCQGCDSAPVIGGGPARYCEGCYGTLRAEVERLQNPIAMLEGTEVKDMERVVKERDGALLQVESYSKFVDAFDSRVWSTGTPDTNEATVPLDWFHGLLKMRCDMRDSNESRQGWLKLGDVARKKSTNQKGKVESIGWGRADRVVILLPDGTHCDADLGDIEVIVD